MRYDLGRSEFVPIRNVGAIAANTSASISKQAWRYARVS
jgi:hypothetical protein